jgi:hypothetical protein
MRTLTTLLALIVLAGCDGTSVSGPIVVDGRGRYELHDAYAFPLAPCVDELGQAGNGSTALLGLTIDFGRGTYDLSYNLLTLCFVTAYDFAVVDVDSIVGARSGSWQIVPPDSMRFGEEVSLPFFAVEAARFVGEPPTHIRLHMTQDGAPLTLALPAVR